MGRGLCGGLAVLAVVLAGGALPASADTTSLQVLDANAIFQQAAFPGFDPATVTALTALPPLPGEVLNDPPVVTDAELADAGAAPLPSVGELRLFAATDDPPLIVDDDRAQCPNADHTTITAAVQSALPGAHIRVCPGRYAESVIVDKESLILSGQRPQGTVQCPSDAANDETRYAIVEPPSGNGIDLRANGVRLEDFVVRRADGASNGILTSAAHSGYVIQRNVVQENRFIGVDMRSDGALPSYFSHNCVRNQTDRDGFRADHLTNALIENNRFEGNSQALDLLECSCGQLTIAHNDFVSNQIAIPAGHQPGFSGDATQLSASTVEYNYFSGAVFAIVLFPDVIGLRIAYNVLDVNAFGMLLAGAGPNNVIEKNLVRDSFGTGIQLGFAQLASFPTTGNLIQNNRLQANGFAGVRLTWNAVSNTVRENLSSGSGSFGIRAEGARSGVTLQATDNVIERNKSLHNGSVDCSDTSDGAGTSGTANFWTRNVGQTEDRPGLCANPGM